MGLSSTTDKQKEAAWRVEFEALGEQLVSERDRREMRTWSVLFVGIAAVLISIIGLLIGIY
jgi:hypothetical protein